MSRHDTLPAAQVEPKIDHTNFFDDDWDAPNPDTQPAGFRKPDTDGWDTPTPEVAELSPKRRGLIKRLGEGVTAKLELRKQKKLDKRYTQVKSDVGAEQSALEPGSEDWGNARAYEGQAATVAAAEAEYKAAEAAEAEHKALVEQEEAKLRQLKLDAGIVDVKNKDAWALTPQTMAADKFAKKNVLDQSIYVAHLQAKLPELAAQIEVAKNEFYQQTELARMQEAHIDSRYGKTGLLEEIQDEQAREEAGTW